jgi:pimeloyl-ACP methyl ester carboxylesterase
MLSQASAVPASDHQSERYRQAERRLWDRYGLQPTERFVEVGSPPIRLRVLEIGSGEPVLFVHGTAGLGAWPPLLGQLSGMRSLVLERPGWGLSAPIDYSKHLYRRLTADLLAGVLDALSVVRASLVAASIGNVWALSLAAAHPSRVDRIALLGGSPLVPDIRPPRIIRLLASPIGALMVRLPPKERLVLAQLRQDGHAASLDAGRIPEGLIDWRLAMSRETRSMRHERDMVRSILGRDGWRPGLTFDHDELAAVRQPTLVIWGSSDPVGSPEVWKRAVEALPAGELRVIDGAGHTPWLDAPNAVSSALRRFLAE